MSLLFVPCISVAPPVTRIEWDISTLHMASGTMVLSNNNLTLNTPAVGVHSINSNIRTRTTGKYYWEIKVDYGSSANILVVSTSWNGTSGGGYNVPGCWVKGNGVTRALDTLDTGRLGIGTGSVVQCAVDLNARKVWFGVNNTWELSGSPSAGTGQTYNLDAIVPIMPAFYISTTPGEQVTARFKADSFSYSPPTGFLPWQL